MFIHPALLWGLLLVSVPLVIHLINLLRHRRVRWAAMEFLLAAYRKHRTRVRMKELLLLLMRMAAVALVVLIVAQPLLKSRLGAVLGGIKIHHVVLLDDSFSMSERLQENGTFDNARRVIAQLADETSRQTFAQQFTLLRTSQSTAGQLKPDFHAIRMDAEFPTQLQGVLENTQPSESALSILSAVEAVEELVPDSPEEKRMVYLLTDFRRRDWEENAELVAALKKLDDAGVTLRLVDCSEAELPNLTISDLRPDGGTRAVDVPLRMTVRVTNYSAAAVKNVVVHPQTESSSTTQTLPALNIAEIPPWESMEETFPVRFPTAGTHCVVASLDADAILTDNTARCAEEFPPFESVLVIDEDADGATAKPLLTALAPGGKVNTGIVARLESPRFLSTHVLDEFQTIYLLDVQTLDASAVTALETFLKNGGSVACFLGNRTDPLLTQKWYREGAGFFPVLLSGTSVELPVDLLQKIPDMRVSTHPIFRVFDGKAAALLKTVNVSRYYTLEDETLGNLIPLETAQSETASDVGRDPNGVRILATLRNNAPLVVERAYGKGRVVVFLTSADASWNNWSRGNPSYVVAMLQLQAYLAHAQETPSEWRVGAPLTLALDGEKFLPEVRFFDADANLLETVQAIPDKAGVLHAASRPIPRAGFYTAEYTSLDRQILRKTFAVQVDSREGNTARLNQETLAEMLKDVSYEFSAFEAFHYGDESLDGIRLAEFLLYFLLIWLFLEMLLAASASYHLKEWNR